jgi:hypothetical protein
MMMFGKNWFDLDHIYFTYNYNGLYITVYDIQHNHEVSYTRAYAIPKHTLQDLRDYLNFEKRGPNYKQIIYA